MLNPFIHTYQNTKLSAVRKFSDQTYDILEEPGFLDDGFIRMKIESLKAEYKNIEDQLEQLLQFDKKDEYHQQKVSHFSAAKDDLLIHMAFLASNGFNSIDFAERLIETMNFDFSLCLKALAYYKENREAEAFELFEKYFSRQERPLEHFLISKIYGLLLLKNHHLQKAAIYLRKAAEKRPEDLEVHQYLIEVYEACGNVQQAQIHQGIIRLLGGVPS